MCSHHTEHANLSFCVWSYSEAQAVVEPEAILLLQHPTCGCQASIVTLGSRVTSLSSACGPVRCPLKAVSPFCFCCCDEIPWESSRETRCSLAHGSALGSVSAWKTPQGFRQLTPLHLSPRSSAEWSHACMLERCSAEWPHPARLYVVQSDCMPAC